MDAIFPWLHANGIALIVWMLAVVVGSGCLIAFACGLAWGMGYFYRVMKVVDQHRLSRLVEANRVQVVLTERDAKRRAQSDGALREKIKELTEKVSEASTVEKGQRKAEEDLRRLHTSQDEVLAHRARRIEDLERALAEMESAKTAADATHHLAAVEWQVANTTLREDLEKERATTEHMRQELQSTQMAATMLDRQFKAQQHSLEMANATVADLNGRRDLLQEQLRSAEAQLATVREMAGVSARV